jgi:hypothetical protein
MHHAKPKWKILRLVFIALLTLTWGVWLVCILEQLYVLRLPTQMVRRILDIQLVSMGLLLVWSFVVYWREPWLARVGWLSLLAIILTWVFVPIASGL